MVHREYETAPADDPARTPRPLGAPATPPAAAPVTRVSLELPIATIVKVLITIAVLLILGQVWQVLFLLFLGLFIAMVLDRPVSWVQERGVPRGLAIAVVLGGALGLVALGLWFVTPGLVTQVEEFWTQLPVYIEIALAWTAERWPDFYEQAVVDAQWQSALNTASIDLQGVLAQGMTFLAGIVNVVITLVIAIYILADQGQSLLGLYQWLPPGYASKVRRTFPAVAHVVNRYVTGQVINSTLFGLFALILLTILDVPSVAVLALLAAIGDAIPQVGVTLATIPTVLLALTQSVQTALIVIVAYAVYQQIENYIISPRVFSRTLELRPLIALIAILIGGKLLGIVGLLLALPVAAAIPAVVAIWREDAASTA